MEIKKAVDVGGTIRNDISKIFTDGFYNWLKYFSKDKNKLARAFRHIFNLNVFYVAMDEGKPVGIVSCTDGKEKSICLNKNELKKRLGFFKGTFASIMLKRELEDRTYPFPMKPGMGSIEFVAVLTDYRGRGVASSIITHIHDTTPYEKYVLEVADTNESAIKLYKKLGYKEFKRVKQKNAKRSGIHYLIYMERVK